MDEFEANYNNAETFDFSDGVPIGGNRFNPTHNHKISAPHVVSFIQKRQLNPGGAGIFALATYGTPPFNPIGNAYYVRRMPHPCEPAIQVLSTSDVNTQLGGLIAGQYVGQPLYDPASDTYGGIDYGDE